jgi:phage-related minor tail protein
MQARIDPASRAFRQYEQRVSQVRLAVEAGAASQREAESVLEGLTEEYERVKDTLGNLSEASAANDNEVTHSTANYRRFGAVAQQAGYQVGDFAVQIASGQNALVAFTQQGAQLLGFFGPWGAVLGAVVAVAGAFAVALWDTDDAADEAATSLERYKESVKDAEAFIKRLNDETKTQAQLLRDQQAELLKTAQARVKAAIAALEERKARVEAMNKKSNDLGFGIENEEIDRGSYQRLIDQISEYKQQLADLNKDTDDAIEKLKEFRKAQADLDVASIDRLAEAWKRSAEAVRQAEMINEIENRVLKEGEERRAEITKAIEGEYAARKRLDAVKSAKEQADAVRDLIAEMQFEYDQLGRSGREQNIYNAIKRAGVDLYSKEAAAIRDAAGALYDYRARIEDLSKAAEKEFSLYAKGASVTEQNRTAVERYNDEVAQLREMVALGAISQETFNRAVASSQSVLARAQDDIWGVTDAMRAQMEGAKHWSKGAEKAFEDYSRGANDAAANSQRLASSGFSSLEDALVSINGKAKSTKEAFTDMVDGILADFQRLIVRQSITGPLAKIASGALTSLIGGAFGGGGGVDYSSPDYDWSQVGGGTGDMTSPDYNWDRFADGGIMTDSGPVPLRRYSSGGIATGRQFAEFGEGSVPEAYVPVPSGKIPVDLKLPKAAASSAAGTGGGSVYNIDARGADQSAIARLESTIVALGGVVKRMDSGFDKRAVGAVSGAVQRGGAAARTIRGR